MNKLNDIYTFLEKHLDKLSEDGSGGMIRELPNFEISAYEYLYFAELNLNDFYRVQSETQKTERLISCISNLKRAIENQIDSVFYVFNILPIFQKRNLGINKKLEFFGSSGIFRSNSIKKLIAIRNKIEHDYSKPDIQDLEISYELVSNFISILSNLLVFSKTIDIFLCEEDNEEKAYSDLAFSLDYDFENTTFKIELRNEKEKSESKEFEISIQDYNEFSKIFELSYLLHLRYAFASDQYILERLKSTI
ncbi:hypothetical protein LPTSP3_g31380 [Leptospira kobayashii]|uniref:Uncharacterized protein n=1 Tax=Leptospira kobayashii TaxID=1917830 RepID=A0ABM7USM3_9LEPT|nr:hypothetical protein [Leptospira kobayashii]BDA80208.1 hypothetical protein LPTSP3_g31380 [Leptospira kobayashii]